MPLRPELYRRLQRIFGKVIIAHPGEAFQARVDKNAYATKFIVDNPGEYYRCACPFCNDTRYRLWINHRWGYYDEQVKSLNLWLCICYNENCLASYARQQALYRQVFDDTRVGSAKTSDVIYQGSQTFNLDPDTEASWPGEITYLNELPLDHVVNQYLVKRNFNPQQLALDYHLSYCALAKPDYTKAKDRLIIPIYQHGILKGWQGRSLLPTVSKYEPKYYTQPGCKKSLLLYNLDNARKHPYTVIVEGPADVWRYGPEAVALFGHHASHYQVQQLLALYEKGVWQYVVILLDADAAEQAQALYDLLTPIKARLIVPLDYKTDPADYSTEALRCLVYTELTKQFPESKDVIKP